MGKQPTPLRLLPEDLRLRIVAAFVAVACVSQLHSLAVAAGVLAAVAAAVWLGAPGKAAWRRLLHVEGFMLLLFATLPFTMAGRPLLTVGPLTASVEGSWRAALIACKVSSSVLLLTALLGTVEPARLGAALRGLYVPERVCRLFAMTARYVWLIRDEARRLHDAMRARGFRPRSNRHTWRSYGNLIGMLLVRSLDRAQRIEEAMLCRGYSGRFPHVARDAPALRDWAGLALLAGLGAVALAVDRL